MMTTSESTLFQPDSEVEARPGEARPGEDRPGDWRVGRPRRLAIRADRIDPVFLTHAPGELTAGEPPIVAAALAANVPLTGRRIQRRYVVTATLPGGERGGERTGELLLRARISSPDRPGGLTDTDRLRFAVEMAMARDDDAPDGPDVGPAPAASEGVDR